MNCNLIQIAFSQYGITEVPGIEDNPEIIKYFNEFGYDGEKLKDETAWCTISHNWILKKAGFQYTGKLNARSFLNLGEGVEKPQFFDTVIFWREDPQSWKGHVGFYIRHRGQFIETLGGNQNNKYCIWPYPINGRKSGLLEFRRIPLAA